MKEAVARLQRVKWVNDVQHSCNTTCPVQWAAEKYRRLALAQDDQKNAKRVRQLGEHFSTRDVVWHLFEERLAPHTKTLDEFLPKRDELIDGQIDVRTFRLIGFQLLFTSFVDVRSLVNLPFFVVVKEKVGVQVIFLFFSTASVPKDLSGTPSERQ